MVAHQFGGHWTEDKLEVVRKYLAGYVNVLKNKPFQRFYIDAFAGTGDRTEKRTSQETLFDLPDLDQVTKGSARLALEVEPPFHRHIFIEKSKKHSSALERLREQFPNRSIEILNEDANEAIQRLCRETQWRFNRAVLFLDPYGMQVSWDTLRAVARTRAIDVWVLFPSGMGMNRLLTKNGEIPSEWQETLDRFLGCSDWRDAFYSSTESVDLFGDVISGKVKGGKVEDFGAFFLERLRTIFEGVAPEGLPLKNSRGQTMYHLCFACANAKGAEIAVRIAKSVIKKQAK